MINTFTILGRVVSKPTLHKTKQGTDITTLYIATNEVWKQDGELKKRAIFHDITLWRELAVNATKVLDKGDLVAVEGKIDNVSKQETIDGVERKKTYISLIAQRFTKVSSPFKKGEDVDGEAKTPTYSDDASEKPF